MKNNILSIILTLFITVIANSQITEGHISYTIVSTTSNPEMEMLLVMMDSSKLEVYFTKDKTRAEMTMGIMMTVTTITDSKSKEMLMLMDGNGQKNAFKSPIPEASKDSIDSFGNKITLSEETKTIQNYVCKKAIITDSLGVQSVYWYTNLIDVNLQGQTYFNSLVPGFPLEYEIINGELKMLMAVTLIEKKISKDLLKKVFNTEVPKEYTLVSVDELKGMSETEEDIETEE